MHLKKHFLTYALIILSVFAFAASYQRFMVDHDYLVSYEGPCDPETDSCYVECEDEECTAEYYFTVIERPALEIYGLCGENILDCEAAESCPASSVTCSVTYCDPEIEGEEMCLNLAVNAEAL